MRSVAIMLVVFCHSMLAIWYGFSVPWVALCGIYGVEIFFVLSGFLIGGILIRDFQRSSKFSDLRSFWIRRWFRTLPNYYLFLVINILVFWWIAELPSDLWQYPLFFQNFGSKISSPVFSESWSLSIEEWFYIITPFLFFTFLKVRANVRYAALATIVVVLAGGNLLRIYAALSDPSGKMDMRTVVIMRLDACMFGVLAAWIKYCHPALWNRVPRVIGVVGVGMMAFAGYIFLSPHSAVPVILRANLFTVITFGAFLTLQFFEQWKSTNGISEKIWSRISLWSYSIYLVNLPLFVVVKHFFGPEIRKSSGFGLLAFFGCIGAVVLIAAFNYRFFEKPMTDLRDRFGKQRQRS